MWLKVEIKDSFGTLKNLKNFNPKDEAIKLNKAMAGFGTDEDVVIEFLVLPSNQKNSIVECYSQLYGKNFCDEIKSDLSGYFRTLALALMKNSDEVAYGAIKAATKGRSTNINLIFAVLLTRTNEERNEIVKLYNSRNKKTLEKVVEGECSELFKTLISFLFENGKVEFTDNIDNIEGLVNRNLSKIQAERFKELFDLEQSIIDTSLLYEVFLQQNRFQAAACIQEYNNSNQKTLLESGRSYFSQEDQFLMKQLIDWTIHPVGYFSACLQCAFKGHGTDEDLLNFVIADRCEKDLMNISDIFKRSTGKSLQSVIRSETSGDYRKLLLRLLS